MTPRSRALRETTALVPARRVRGEGAGGAAGVARRPDDAGPHHRLHATRCGVERLEIASNNVWLARASDGTAAASSLVRPPPTSAPLVGPPLEALTNGVERHWFALQRVGVGCP